MAEAESYIGYKLPLQKGSICQVMIEDITNNVILVVLKNGSSTYRGALLNQIACGPHGLERFKSSRNDENNKVEIEMTSKSNDKDQDNTGPVEESSLSLRSSYQENHSQDSSPLLSPLRAISKSLQDKNIRKRMLRPRHVLCSNCKSFCDGSSSSRSEKYAGVDSVKRKLTINESSKLDSPLKRQKKDERLESEKTFNNNRPAIKISISSTNESRSKITSSTNNEFENSEYNRVESVEKRTRDSALAHSPSVLLRRIDWDNAIEKQHSMLKEQNNQKHEKEHKHKRKRKHKKHKHRTSIGESDEKHKRHKKRTKQEASRPLQHSSGCLKIKTKIPRLPESCVKISTSPLLHNTTYILDNNEDSSSHSAENYQISSKLDRNGLPYLEGYSDGDSTDTYDFPQTGLDGEDSDSEPLVNALRPLTMKIQTINVFKCAIPDGRTITVGDIVWGKIHGFPAWPARVISLSIRQRDTGVSITKNAHVSWFGSRTRSHMLLNDLHPFIEDYHLKFNKKKKGPYKLAVRQASLAAQQSLPEYQDVDIEG